MSIERIVNAANEIDKSSSELALHLDVNMARFSTLTAIVRDLAEYVQSSGVKETIGECNADIIDDDFIATVCNASVLDLSKLNNRQLHDLFVIVIGEWHARKSESAGDGRSGK